jgi:hypothetical protein
LLWFVEAGVVGCILFLGVLFAQYKDAQALQTNDRQALATITAIAALMGLMNCPFFGAGMGECLVYLAASLWSLRR